MKKVIAIMLSIALLFGLSACGGNDGKETPNTDTRKPNTPQNQNTPQKPNQTQTSDGSEYWGVYEMDDGYLVIYDDGTFDVANFDGSVYNYGTYRYEDGLTLTSTDGESILFVLDEYNNLYGGEKWGTLFRIDPNDLPDGYGDIFDETDYGDFFSDPVDDQGDYFSDPVDNQGDYFSGLYFEGYWMDKDGYILEIVSDTWYLYDDGGRMINRGPAEFEGAQAWLMNQDGSSGGGYLYFDDDGDLIDSGYVLTRLDGFPYGNSENEVFYDILEGEWFHTDAYGSYEYPKIYFDGFGSFVWYFGDECHTGTYILDGDEILCRYDDDDIDVYWSMTFQNGKISVEGDAGSWYSQ